ncbi:DREPP plasma membrane polypeptide family protein [Tripterygium wilfordii]|uniref:DREPP plasma membrane polypeptide family protein n=1 Tax=Tripterygium wilfordii TaxID=458696 RepID=A0A7J7D823_TRIWF|nr:plasma membrane-associated cation-binding protein 1 [Tripterygium wilfordii]KAF5742399.1 DREPP plasma membrane polypeptide family protein [Tripterygium wilfordii]
MGYWKSKVLPKIKKVFEKDSTKKAAAAEASKSFDDSKEEINKEFEEKKTEIQPKVVEIYEASSAEIKVLVKEAKEPGLKKHSAAVQKFIDELVKIEFPGSKVVSELCTKFGPPLASGPIFFIFEKVSTFIPAEKKVEKTGEEETSTKDKEIAVEPAKVAEAEKTETPAPAETAKVEEAAPAAEPPKA